MSKNSTLSPHFVYNYIIAPALEAMHSRFPDHKHIDTAPARRLVLYTFAHESGMFQHVRQIQGPALGFGQVEPATFTWLQGLRTYQDLGLRYFSANDLEWNHWLCAIVTRLRYLVVPSTLPDDLSEEGLPYFASYWKQHYNTVLGKGRVEDFVATALECQSSLHDLTQASLFERTEP